MAPDGRAGRRALGFVTRLGAFYAAIFFLAGTKTTYLPVWLDALGLSAGEIALIAAMPMFLRIVATPLLALAADRYGDHRGALVALAWFAALSLLALTGVRGFWPIFALTLALSLSSTTIMPLTETIAMEGVRRAGFDYGRMRLWGSLSFIAATFLAGFAVEASGARAVIWVLLAGGVAIALAAHALPHPEAEAGTARPAAPRKVIPADLVRLLASRRFALFLLAVGAIQGAHAMFYTFGVLHWRSQGIGPVTASVLWGIGVATEIGLFAFSGAVVRRTGPLLLLVIGGAASVLRWLVMMLDPPLALLLPLQALHGITYGATHLGAVHYIAAVVSPERAGTAQALYGSVASGIVLGAATLAVGALYPLAGGITYGAMALLSGAGLAATFALLRSPDERGERDSG